MKLQLPDDSRQTSEIDYDTGDPPPGKVCEHASERLRRIVASVVSHAEFAVLQAINSDEVLRRVVDERPHWGASCVRINADG